MPPRRMNDTALRLSPAQEQQYGLGEVYVTWDKAIAAGYVRADAPANAHTRGMIAYKSSRTTPAGSHSNPNHLVPIENVLVRHEIVEEKLKHSLAQIQGGATSEGDVEEGDIALLGELTLRWRLGALAAIEGADIQQSFADIANRRALATHPDNIAIWGSASRLQRLTGQSEPEPAAFDRETELLHTQLRQQGNRISKQLKLETARARIVRGWLQAENQSQLIVATKAAALRQEREVSKDAFDDFKASAWWPRFRLKHLNRLAHQVKTNPDARADPGTYDIVIHGYALSRLHGALLKPLRPLSGVQTLEAAEAQAAEIRTHRDQLQAARPALHPAFYTLIDSLVDAEHGIVEATESGHLGDVRDLSVIARQLIVFYCLPSEQSTTEFVRWHGLRL